MIKEKLVDVYRSHGIDFMTACQFATEFMRELRKEKPGTIWHVTAKDGTVLAVKYK